MATVNFSVPEEVKRAFNETFKDQNKSAIIADLMREAIERTHQRQRQSEAIDRILERRKRAYPHRGRIRAARERPVTWGMNYGVFQMADDEDDLRSCSQRWWRANQDSEALFFQPPHFIAGEVAAVLARKKPPDNPGKM